jgi:hypothetical protein
MDELRAGSAPNYAEIARHIIEGALTDMPAMGAASFLEDEIERRGLDMQYVKHLQVIVGSSAKWHLLRAAPEQRARAFLEAMKGAAE